MSNGATVAFLAAVASTTGTQSLTGGRIVEQIFRQLLDFLQQGIAAIFRFVQLIWTWSIDQIMKVLQVPWADWPLWKQILLVLVGAAVIWALYKAAKDLWEAGEKILSAFASLLGVLVKTLPRVLVAGLIALGGVWLINNLDSNLDFAALNFWPFERESR